MKIGVLEAGAPPRGLQGRFGRYPAMFEALLASGAHQFETHDVRSELPADVEACGAWLVTGSAAGVNDGDPWIARTGAFLRAAKGRAALVGVCFGHQLMAQAFGGRVERAAAGWGIGLHRYRVVAREPWMDEAEEVAAPASHQDQVVLVPPGARVVAASPFTPFGMLAWDDARAMSIQLHPEFEPAFAAALVEARRGDVYAEPAAREALDSLAGPNDRLRLARWIEAFLAP